MNDSELTKTIDAYREYLGTAGWEVLVAGYEAKETGCGPVYELGNPLNLSDVDLAIADMRRLKIAEPHYHQAPDVEVYIVLQGEGLVVNGTEEITVKPGSVVVTPSDTTHYAVPTHDLVIATINTPPFRAERYRAISESDAQYKFDKKQLDRLSH